MCFSWIISFSQFSGLFLLFSFYIQRNGGSEGLLNSDWKRCFQDLNSVSFSSKAHSPHYFSILSSRPSWLAELFMHSPKLNTSVFFVCFFDSSHSLIPAFSCSPTYQLYLEKCSLNLFLIISRATFLSVPVGFNRLFTSRYCKVIWNLIMSLSCSRAFQNILDWLGKIQTPQHGTEGSSNISVCLSRLTVCHCRVLRPSGNTVAPWFSLYNTVLVFSDLLDASSPVLLWASPLLVTHSVFEFVNFHSRLSLSQLFPLPGLSHALTPWPQWPRRLKRPTDVWL